MSPLPPQPRFSPRRLLARAGADRGIGPARIKKLIEHYGTAERVFQASLTELEATGMRAVSAQSMATGKSLELAQQECDEGGRGGRQNYCLAIPNTRCG
jgi:predicted Rossmann fold nucleotide-binding protein DprA/Smf involved in DNA uptake